MVTVDNAKCSKVCECRYFRGGTNSESNPNSTWGGVRGPEKTNNATGYREGTFLWPAKTFIHHIHDLDSLIFE